MPRGKFIPMAKIKKTAFGLIRVSTSEQDMQSQKDELRRIAESKGYSIDDEDFFSEKITGYDEQDFDRPSIVQLNNTIQVRKPDAVFVLELSRLTRRATKVSHYIDTLSITPKVPMYFADYDIWTIDPKTLAQNDDGILTLYGGARSVEIERERIRSRTSRGRDAKAEKGLYVGHLKDGYICKLNENNEKEIVVDENRKEMIETMFNLYVNKDYSTADIRNYLNSNHYPTTNKYRYEHKELFKGYKSEYKDRNGNILSRVDTIWSDSMVSGILKDEWYVGIRRYHQKEYSIEPIVSKELWDACQKKLQQYRTNTSNAKQTYMLGGLLFCGVCGRKLYGHSDGGYGDMYYCSSYEYGKDNKCGLRWVRRQNLDAIVYDIVRRRVYSDITLGIKSPFSDYFSVDKLKLNELEKKIKTYKSLIKNTQDNISEKDKQISFLIAQQAKHYNDPDNAARYEAAIDVFREEIEKSKNEILQHEVSIEKLKKQKKTLASVSNKLKEIRDLSDYEESTTLVKTVVAKITLYNSDEQTTIIKITYVNEKEDVAIYNPIKLKKKYIVLTMDEWKERPCPIYNAETKKIVFEGLYLAVRDNMLMLFDEEESEESPIEKEIRKEEGRVKLGTWDTPANRERVISEYKEFGVKEEDATKLYNKWVEEGVIWKDITDAINRLESDGFRVYKDEVSVLDYIQVKKNGTLNVFPFADLVPMSERGERIRNYHQEYQKRYNTGKTFESFVVKDVNYQDICKKRKHLYNRKYKILKNKHLSQEQKQNQIFKIMEQLDAYKYQLKYLPTNKKGQNHIDKYNSSTSQE